MTDMTVQCSNSDVGYIEFWVTSPGWLVVFSITYTLGFGRPESSRGNVIFA